jgi:hypothetical protein
MDVLFLEHLFTVAGAAHVLQDNPPLHRVSRLTTHQERCAAPELWIIAKIPSTYPYYWQENAFCSDFGRNSAQSFA